MRSTIYVLKDPITFDVKYVGQTSRSLSKRLSEHIKRSKKQISNKDNWISNLRANGLKPVIEIFCEVDTEYSVDAEKKAITFFESINCSLFNKVDPIDPIFANGKLNDLKYAEYLGNTPDREIARIFGMAVSSIRDARVRRNVATSGHSHNSKLNCLAYKHLLGEKLDSDIAKEFGVTKQIVGKHRRELGISPVGEYPRGSHGRE